jgi:hypothetical protein
MNSRSYIQLYPKTPFHDSFQYVPFHLKFQVNDSGILQNLFPSPMIYDSSDFKLISIKLIIVHSIKIFKNCNTGKTSENNLS